MVGANTQLRSQSKAGGKGGRAGSTLASPEVAEAQVVCRPQAGRRLWLGGRPGTFDRDPGGGGVRLAARSRDRQGC